MAKDKFKKPSGYIKMILHSGGYYDINTDKIIGGTILSEREFHNLIVNSASNFMACRMAPGTSGGRNISNGGYVAGKSDGEFDTYGLRYLAIGVGPIENNENFYDANTNPLKNEFNDDGTPKWDPSNPPEAVPSDNKLKGEICRKEFTDWKFIDTNGKPSETPTPVLLLSITLDDSDAIGPLTEMGLFGGSAARKDKPNTGYMFNYKTFPVLNKPKQSKLTITWQLTF